MERFRLFFSKINSTKQIKMERFITFLEPWGKRSWKVTFDGPYENDRFPHVEVGEENMNKHIAGEKHALSNLHASAKALI